jgi:hypothetical protein
MKARRLRGFKKNSRRVKKVYKNYNFIVKTDLISYCTPDYTERNLKFDLESLLQSNTTFQTLKKMYINYKIKCVNFKAVPRVINGTQPQPCFIYLDTNNGYNFNYTALPRLQATKMLTGKRSQTFKFKARGRQDDFGYWFSANDGPTASIRLRSQAAPDTNIFWQFQLIYFITMRGMIQEEQQQKNNEGEDVVECNVDKIQPNDSVCVQQNRGKGDNKQELIEIDTTDYQKNKKIIEDVMKKIKKQNTPSDEEKKVAYQIIENISTRIATYDNAKLNEDDSFLKDVKEANKNPKFAVIKQLSLEEAIMIDVNEYLIMNSLVGKYNKKNIMNIIKQSEAIRKNVRKYLEVLVLDRYLIHRDYGDYFETE